MLERLDPGYGIAIVRIITGVVLFLAGYEKWTGPGIAGVTRFFGSVGIPAPSVMAPLLMGFEVVGGLLLIVGFLSRFVGLVMIPQFLVAGLLVSLPSQFGWNGARLDFLLAACGALFFLAGSGALSLDAWRGSRRTAERSGSPTF